MEVKWGARARAIVNGRMKTHADYFVCLKDSIILDFLVCVQLCKQKKTEEKTKISKFKILQE